MEAKLWVKLFIDCRIISLYKKIEMMLREIIVIHRASRGRRTVVAGGTNSANSSLSVVSCRHSHKNEYLGQLLETGCYDCIVSKQTPCP
jgi:hypothetical protein